MITFDNNPHFLLKDFLLDNVEEDSANRNEMRKNPIHIKTQNEVFEEKNSLKLVNYDDEDEEIGKSMSFFVNFNFYLKF